MIREYSQRRDEKLMGKKRYKEGCEMEYKPQGRVYPKISLAAHLFVLSRL
jgi:hypothetical protein